MIKKKGSRFVRLLILVLVLIFGIVFTLLNPGLIEVNFVAKVVSIPLTVLMLICFALGLTLGLLIGYTRAWWRTGRGQKEESVDV